MTRREYLRAVGLGLVWAGLMATGCGPEGAGSIDLDQGGAAQVTSNPGRFAPAPAPKKGKAARGRPRTRP